MKKKETLIVAIIVVAIALVGSFYGGMKYQQSQAGFKNPGNFGQGMRQNKGSGMGGANQKGLPGQPNKGNMMMGEILSKDDKSITLKLPDGGSKIIFLSEKTEITKSVAGEQKDLETGKNVFINGTPNADGSITATTIQLR